MYSSRTGNIIHLMGTTQKFNTAKEMSEKWGVSVRMISNYCSEGKIPGSEKIGNMWIIPKNAQKPADHRFKEVKNASC